MIPGGTTKSPANGGVVETVGIEPTSNSRHITADGYRVLLDPEDAWLLENPRWTWRYASANPARSGKPYVVRHTSVKASQGFKHTRVYLHRVILDLAHGDSCRVDHINGDTLDNRRANLRVVTTAQNAQNQGSRGGSSRFRGVTWDKSRGKWMATGMLDGRRRTIGRFDDEADAAFAAAEWRAEHMPFSEEAAA